MAGNNGLGLLLGVNVSLTTILPLTVVKAWTTFATTSIVNGAPGLSSRRSTLGAIFTSISKVIVIMLSFGS